MRVNRNFGFLLNDVRRRFVLRFEQRAREFALTLPQCRVLATLFRNEGASQARLAQLADVEPMTMVRILDHMEKERLLERRVDPADRRARRLYLTAKAKPLLDRIWQLGELTRREAFVGIARDDSERFVAVLEQMQTNLSSHQPELIDTPAPQARARPRKTGRHP